MNILVHDAKEIKKAAAGRWPEILENVGGISPKSLTGNNGPCPKCGGKDRFRFIEMDAGAVLCNQCFKKKNGDGIAAVQWMLECTFMEAVDAIGKYLRIQGSKTEQQNGKSKIVATYDYRDAGGELLFQVVRHDPKDFRQRRPDGNGGWDWSVKGIQQVLYGLPELIANQDRTVFVVEGEKDVIRLTEHRLLATCNSGGAGKWKKSHAEYLSGRHVVVLPDNDDAGRNHADQVSQSLVGLAASIKIVDLPGLLDKGDVSDWLDTGNTVDQLTKLVEDASIWVPTTEPPTKQSLISEAAIQFRLEKYRTENSVATAIIDRHKRDMRFCPHWKKWLIWDGRRWSRDDSGICALRFVRRYANGLWPMVGELATDESVTREELGVIRTFTKSMNKNSTMDAVLSLARTDERICVDAASLDQKPLFLNCINGTLNLSTGCLANHERDDLITQLCPTEWHPGAKCPKWESALSLIFDDDKAVISFVQRLLGYSISGDIAEHVLPICHGGGCNGKSFIWNCVQKLLGDEYAMLADDSLLLGTTENHPTDKASLHGKRFVPIAEPDDWAKLRESRVKALTGDGVITARRMKEDFWSFNRTHKFWLATNHLPQIQGTDDGIWRRVRLIPFTVDIRNKCKPIPDYHLQLLREEGPGILAWLVQGFQAWQREGLGDPDAVRTATTNYREDSDPLGDFLDEYCVLSAQATVTAKELFQTYQHSGGKWSSTAFGRAMSDRFKKEKPSSGPYRRKTIYRGVGLWNDRDQNIEKNEENGKCHQLSPVDLLRPRDLANSIVLTGRLVTTGDNGGLATDLNAPLTGAITPINPIRPWENNEEVI